MKSTTFLPFHWSVESAETAACAGRESASPGRRDGADRCGRGRTGAARGLVVERGGVRDVVEFPARDGVADFDGGHCGACCSVYVRGGVCRREEDYLRGGSGTRSKPARLCEASSSSLWVILKLTEDSITSVQISHRGCSHERSTTAHTHVTSHPCNTTQIPSSAAKHIAPSLPSLSPPHIPLEQPSGSSPQCAPPPHLPAHKRP